MPRGVHQWAQADRYALAAKFTENLDFWHPATYSQISDQGELGVEFPLMPYSAAGLSMLFGEHYLPFLYRLLSFLLLFSGLAFLAYRLLKPLGMLPYSAILIGLFSSPLLLFYAANFLPDAAALGLVLWGIALCFTHSSKPFLYAGIVLLVLAALVKTSSGIYLLAYLSSVILSLKKGSARENVFILALGFAGLLFIAYYDYFQIHLRNKQLWSTLFLSSTHPITNITEFIDVLKAMYEWKWEYFSLPQWIIAIAALVYGLFISLKSKKWSQTRIFILFSALGLLAVLLLFGKQFIHHDYYFIASFYPILFFGILLGLKSLGSHLKGLWNIVLILFSVLSFSFGSNQYFDRMSESCTMGGKHHFYAYEWLDKAQAVVQQNVEQENMIFVVYEMEPNLALVYFQRNGIVFNREEMGREESNFYYWLERRKPKYVLCRAQHLSLFEAEHADFIAKCKLLESNTDYNLYEIHGH